jgi:hypothetical protein
MSCQRHEHEHPHEHEHAHEHGCGHVHGAAHAHGGCGGQHTHAHDDADETEVDEEGRPFGFERHFFTAAERRDEIDAHIQELEAYLNELEAEATAVRERLVSLKSKS